MIPGLKSVEVKPDKNYRELLKPSRTFGLETAPTLYPNEQEFADPYKYIESFRNLGLKYGILKIVPPASWNPRFALDPATFKFECRKQLLNGMGAMTRTITDFVTRLSNFHSLRGDILDKFPKIGDSVVDYYTLKRTVANLGGFQRITMNKKWNTVGAILKISNLNDPEVASDLEELYREVILPFEQYLNDIKSFLDEYGDNEETQQKPKEEEDQSEENTDDEQTAKAEVDDYDEEADDDDEDDEDEVEEENDVYEARILKRPCRRTRGRPKKIRKEEPQLRRSLRLRASSESLKEAIKVEESEPLSSKQRCLVCTGGATDLECNECHQAFHARCLTKRLYVCRFVSQWHCPHCLAGDGEFYFDQGEMYTLAQFQQMANRFYGKYIGKYLPGVDVSDGELMENVLEEQFWSHVNDLNCKIAVEYGADIRCDKSGSGFPTEMEDAKYAKDPWNLNNFPHNPMSLLRYLRSNISGVTVPWAYVGMLFSAFCWHSEDHYTYSLNYQHFGDTKTWYGIPGSFATKFEQVTRDLVPDLFDKQPHILYQRSTLVSPDVLTSRGIPVYAVDQHAGQFVVTFPNAYHAGFNQGFNFNEAVNFAPADWLSDGRQAIVDLKRQKKSPIFSHEDLLLRVAVLTPPHLRSTMLTKLYPYLLDIVEQELESRKTLISDLGGIPEISSRVDPDDEDSYQCADCKCLCYLSRITYADTNSGSRIVYCYEHAPRELKGKLVLETTYGLDQLYQVIERIQLTK